MITRRTLTVGTGALATGIALGAFLPRPAVAIEAGISPRLAALADAWKETWAAYHKVIGQAFATAQSNERPGIASDFKASPVWLEPAQLSLAAALRVLDEPSHTRSDVILKYHVIDDLTGRWPVPDWMWTAAHCSQRCRIVEHEAREFDLAINPFWLATASPFAEIDGDRDAPAWRDVERWVSPRA